MTDPIDMNALMAQYAELWAQRDALNAAKEELRQAVLEPVKLALEEIELEFAEGFETIDAHLKELEAMMIPVVIAKEESFKGPGWNVVYRKPSIAWDDAKLLAYAREHNEIISWRKVGKPSASVQMARGRDAGNSAALAFHKQGAEE